MFPRAVRTRSCIALSLSAILLTACSIDQSAEPRKTVAASRAIASSTPTDHWAQPHFTPNGIKYSDHGAKPSTGRSGSAGLTSSALLRRDGSVVVSVMSFDVRDPSTPAGTIAKLDYKIYDTRGNKVPATMQVRPIDGTQTSNGKGADDDHAYGNTITFYGAGIYAGYRIVLQGNVRDINGSRTDIVNVADTVKLSPDPSVVKLAAPAQGYANDLVVIDALVKELNGDTGARGNCVLYDGATVIGRANGIWVDAGDEVDCKFAARFSALGVHQLRAAIENVTPADWDLTNNTRTAQITIVARPIQMGYHAEALQHTADDHSLYEYWYAAPSVGYSTYYQKTVASHAVEQYSRIYAWADAPITFPVERAEIAQSTDGVAIEGHVFTALAATSSFGTAADGGQCSAQQGDNGNAFLLCTYWNAGGRWSSAYFDHYAGAAIYISAEYATYSWPSESGYYFWIPGHVDAMFASGLNEVPFGRSISFTVNVKSGAVQLTATPTVTLTTNAYANPDVSSCSAPFAQDIGTARTCTTFGGTYVDLWANVWSFP